MLPSLLLPNTTGTISSPSLNASLGAFPPELPDIWSCDKHYSELSRRVVASCFEAFNALPYGNEATSFYTDPQTEDERGHQLPLIVSGNGGCEIQFHVSGPASDEVMVQGQNISTNVGDTRPIQIVPDDIRDMARWVILQCVQGQKTGGMVTQGIKKSLTWLTDPDTIYPGPAPPSTTYYSLFVWKPGTSGAIYSQWNPGNMDPTVGKAVWGYVAAVLDRTSRASTYYRKLEGVLAIITSSVDRMSYYFRASWFDAPA